MRILLAITFSLWLGLPAFAQQEQSIAPELVAALEESLVQESNQQGGRALFDRAIIAHGNPDLLLAEINQRLAVEGLENAKRVAILRVKTAVLQRQGLLQEALECVEQELALEVHVDSVVQRGQLLDCLERREQALSAYSEALELMPANDERVVTLMLRRAMLSMEGDESAKNSLADFANSDACDQHMRNRAAVVLALLGRPQDAIDLFVVEGEGSKLFRQQIRMAEWALKAKDADAAQQWGWQARETATLKRDRYYALTVLSEAHRMDNSLDRLLEAYDSAEQLDQQSHDAWIALLREMGEYDTAVALFEQGVESSDFSNASRRELLEMYREAGREEEMIEQYELLMIADPDNSLWPEGLSRYFLEQGKTEEARALWKYFLVDAEAGLGLVEAAKALMGLGQDDLAIQCAERCVEEDSARFAALQFLFDMHRLRGELELAAAVLERTDRLAPVDSPVRMQLSESFERVGNLERAVEVLEQLRSAREGVGLSEDLEMRLAWLHSEVGNEEIALQRWRDLWLRVDSIPRRRYVEDRMMSVASRLGKLADIAIELEGRLFRGEADKRDSGLLVRLYTNVGDPVSATEIIEEFLKQAGGSEIVALEEKARVFMSCTDYHNYERTVRRLIEIDPEGEAEYLQQIAMSMLERGKPDQARTVLARLKELESNAASAEFEAGVLALAGMEVEAITAYARGLANNPDRIESYLMMAALMQQTGEKDRAIGMFQDIALNAVRDDLFIIAIDGLLNLDAPPSTMSWARRITLERLARRHDKVYLYQLLADLGEQVNDNEARIAALQGSLAIAGDRRVAVVRELMDLSAGRNNSFIFNSSRGPEDEERHLAFGRRLIGLGQLVPPQVYLDLGRTFLSRGAIADASKTFRLARDLPDYDVFQRDVGALFEQSGYMHQALNIYRKVLIGDSTDVGLLVKVGELQEQLSDDESASGLYLRAVELLLARRPVVTGEQQGESVGTFSRWYTRNVDDFDKYFDRSADGMLVTYPQEQVDALLAAQLLLVEQEIVEAVAAQPAEADPLPLSRFPRLFRRSLFVRRMALSYGRPQYAATMDRKLLAAFFDDADLLGRMVKERVRWGLNSAAYSLLLESGRAADEIDKLLWLVGKGVAASATELVPLDEALRLLLPMMANKQHEDARLLLRRVDFGGIKADRSQDAGALFSAAAIIGDQDLSLFLGRNWLRLFISGDNRASHYVVRPVLARVALALNDEYRLSFYQYFVGLVLGDTDKFGPLVTLLPEIQKGIEEPLIEEEQLIELITENHRSLAFSLGPMLKLAPEDSRPGLASAVWSEIAPTMRPWFVFNLISPEIGPLGQEMDDLLVVWFRELLKGDDQSRLRFGLEELTADKNLETNEALVTRLIFVMEEELPDSPLAMVARARLLLRNNQEDEAIDKALVAYFLPEMQDRDNYQFYSARDFIEERIIPLAPKRFLDALDEHQKGVAVSFDRIDQRLKMVRRLNDRELLHTETKRACEQLPDNLDLLKQLYRQHVRRREHEQADALFDSMVEQFPEDESLAELEFSTWLRRDREVKAVEALHRMLALRGPQKSRQVEDDEGEEKIAAANIQTVKKAIEQGDLAAAGNSLRRMWRQFPSDDARFFNYGFGGNWANITWPRDVVKEEDMSEEEIAARDADRARRARGGLDAYEEPKETVKEQQNAWEVLAGYPFGVAEMERFLRSNGPSNLEYYTSIIDGLATARVNHKGEQESITYLLGKVNAGEANKVEILQLLSLLQRTESALGGDVQKVLKELTSSLHPRDGNQLLRLANVMASVGERELALDLYRWCATQTSASSYFSMREEEFGSIDISRLVSEMRDSLKEGDDLIAIIEQALELAKPADNPWEMASYERLVLDTWIGLLEPERALEKCRDICANADKGESRSWNEICNTAAWLYAHENELNRAIECLEAFVGESPWQSIDRRDYPRYFPEDFSSWKNPVAWLNRIGPAMLGWADDNKIPESDGLRATALVVLRLFEQDALADAEVLLQLLAEREFVDATTSLWIADAARRIGQVELANSIEADLFQRDQLNQSRFLEYLDRWVAEEGAEVVLAYGEEMAKKRRPRKIMEFLRDLASESGDKDVAEVWAARVEDAELARQEIDAYYEEQRKQREGNQVNIIRIR
ncbi:MAG: hypothetical protein QF489_00030 [Planctomycetota bacterium]|jgi:tetratricopeptide (TPR) repeat protein|nr:hypothetical protein [Planctomycetota bacterium]